MARKPKVEILSPNEPDEIVDLGDAGVLFHFYPPPPPPYQRQPTDPPWWPISGPPMAHDLKVGKDYSNASFIMKRMWELSRSDSIATIYGVATYSVGSVGTAFGLQEGIKLDHSVTVFAAPSIYDEMVRAMRAYQERDLGSFFERRTCIAVLVQWEAAKGCCEVLWANGVAYTADPPKIHFKPAPAHLGGAYPCNDPTFIGRLELMLNSLRPKRQPRRIGKAFGSRRKGRNS